MKPVSNPTLTLTSRSLRSAFLQCKVPRRSRFALLRLQRSYTTFADRIDTPLLRHTVMCRAAKKVARTTRVSFTRTKNRRFLPLVAQKLLNRFLTNLYTGVFYAFHIPYLTYQIWRRSRQRLPRYSFLKIAQFSSYFSSSHRYKNKFKIRKDHLLVFQFLLNLEQT